MREEPLDKEREEVTDKADTATTTLDDLEISRRRIDGNINLV